MLIKRGIKEYFFAQKYLAWCWLTTEEINWETMTWKQPEIYSYLYLNDIKIYSMFVT